MKFTIFALIAGLCLVAVSANTAFIDTEEIEINGDDLLDVENFTVLSKTYGVFKSALRTLKGINCSIKAVLDITTAATNFIANVESCGADVSKQLQAVINACNNVISTSNDIINVNDNVCKNADGSDDTDDTPPKGCSGKLLKKLWTLNKQIKTAIKLVKKVPSIPTTAGECVNDALNNLTTTFTTFPSSIKSCSKLTSN